MKKLFVLFAALMMTASVSAQNTAVTSNNFGDNWYIGLNGGVATPTKGHAWMKDLTPNLGLRLGKNLNTVFGLALEANAYMKSACDGKGPNYDTKTFIDATDINLLGTFNLSNLFGRYQGKPRNFEVIGLYGFGWGHIYGIDYKSNALTSKVALDFTLNLGEDKAWQIYLEPSLNYGLVGWTDALGATIGSGMKYDINNSNFQLNLGINYKFMTSNGTHNFAIEELRDQAEIDALNAQINELRNRKPQVIEKEKIVEKIVEKEGGVREVKVENLVFVTFAQGKSALTADAKKALDEIAEGKHVQIVGTASPEGSKELNDRLSQARADVVADYLKARGVKVDEATGKGVQGTTSNRLAVVYVK